MAGEHLEAQARRVVSGVNENGKSAVILDEITPVRMATPGFTNCDVWALHGLPTRVDSDDTLTGQVELTPPKGSLVYRITTFPPDKEWDPKTEYKKSLELIGAGNSFANENGDIAGLHKTETVDIVTVLDGELVAILEEGETVLRKGDTFIQRGTLHSWQNRTDTTVTIVALQIHADRG